MDSISLCASALCVTDVIGIQIRKISLCYIHIDAVAWLLDGIEFWQTTPQGYCGVACHNWYHNMA